jgi:predicted negative regulator of RcsB-dependent stress response
LRARRCNAAGLRRPAAVLAKVAPFRDFPGDCMAFDVLDEHEQGELVQKWLRENAAAIITGIVLGLLLIFGWNQWKVHTAQKGTEAAARYQALADAAAAGDKDDAHEIAATLREEHPKSR